MSDLELPPEDASPNDEIIISSELLEGLGSQLVWKIGKEEGSERVVVRVGYASATASFKDLPKLRGLTDTEAADAAKAGELVVEWIE